MKTLNKAHDVVGFSASSGKKPDAGYLARTLPPDCLPAVAFDNLLGGWWRRDASGLWCPDHSGAAAVARVVFWRPELSPLLAPGLPGRSSCLVALSRRPELALMGRVSGDDVEVMFEWLDRGRAGALRVFLALAGGAGNVPLSAVALALKPGARVQTVARALPVDNIDAVALAVAGGLVGLAEKLRCARDVALAAGDKPTAVDFADYRIRALRRLKKKLPFLPGAAWRRSSEDIAV